MLKRRIALMSAVMIVASIGVAPAAHEPHARRSDRPRSDPGDPDPDGGEPTFSRVEADAILAIAEEPLDRCHRVLPLIAGVLGLLLDRRTVGPA